MGTRSAPEGVRISLLGGFGVCVGLHAIDDAAWRLRKARSLIKLLTLAPGHRLHREQVISTLWPDLAPEPALNNLHQTMHIARRALSLALAAREEMSRASNGAAGETASWPPGLLHIHDHIVTLDPPLPLWVDVEAFEQAAARASGTADIGAHEAAILLYTGELLPDDRYEDWTFERREALARRHLTLLSELAQLYEQARDLPRASESFQRVLAADPAHEEAHTGLMRLYALMGQRQAALRQFHDLRNALKDIDADPQPASVELHKAILAGDLAKLSSSSSGLSRGPERQHARPFRGVEAAKRERPGNLPAPLATFIGRERELAVLKDLLAETRLLTLTGPGGSGKTRLGLELAAALRDRFPDGVWWVDLQALQDATQVSQVVAATLGVREQPSRSLETVLTDWLRGRHLLLVLDNCEHLLVGCAALAEALLGACAHLRMLTTSRERLGVPGEARWPVPPMAVPPKDSRLPLEELRTFEAVRLFEIRSHAVNPGFALTDSNAAIVAEICRRLDGLPLAIELAAARTHVLSAAQILDRLTDRLALLTIPGRATPRYSTLAGAIDWSYRLLSETERALFTRLAVFAGGFTLEAAQAICADAPVEAARTLDLLTSLVDKSLVTVEERPDGTVRYRLLETIREYAQEKLASTTEEARIRDRHLSWYLELAEPLAGFESIEPVPQRIAAVSGAIAQEHDNIRAAIDWSRKGGDAERGLRLVYAMSTFWLWQGHAVEGRRWLSVVLQGSGSGSPLLRAKALRKLGRLTWDLGDNAAAARLLEEALACFRELREQYEVGRCLSNLGGVARVQGDYSRAKAFYEESCAIFRDLGAKAALSMVLPPLGGVYRAQGDYDAAEAYCLEGVALSREVDEGHLLPDALLSLAFFSVATGNHAAARPLFEEALDRSRRANLRVLVPFALNGLGCIARSDGDLSKARRLFEEALQLSRETGWKRATADVLRQLASLARLQNHLEEASSFLESSLHELQSTGEKPLITASLEQFAQTAVQKGEHGRASRLFGAVEALREGMGAVMAPVDRAGHERDVSTARMSLDEEAFAEAWAEGRRMTMDEAVSYALRDGRETEGTHVPGRPSQRSGVRL